MKWLSAGLTFVNLSVVCGLLLGMAGSGLDERSAIFALVSGAAFAVAAYLGTSDTATERKKVNSPVVEQERSKSGRQRLESVVHEGTSPAAKRYRHLWLWVMAACLTVFAVRSFCWLLYIDGEQLKIQSPNNLGDLALHITFIRNFASGVALWPDNPIYVFSKLRYPVGIDLFNALLCLVHVDLIRGLVWTGLLASLATFYAFFRWAGAFGVAGFLFNGGIVGFQFFNAEVFGLSGRQNNRVEKYCAIHVCDSARIALRNPGRPASALALARKVLSRGRARSTSRAAAVLGRGLSLRLDAALSRPHVSRPDHRPNFSLYL